MAALSRSAKRDAFSNFKKSSDDIFEMSKVMLCLKHSCKRKQTCVTVMLVLPVWAQVQSENTLASHRCVFEAVVIYSKLTFATASPPPRSWWGNSSHQKIRPDLASGVNRTRTGGEVVMQCYWKLGFVTRSDQPPRIWLEKINWWNPSISASLMI